MPRRAPARPLSRPVAVLGALAVAASLATTTATTSQAASAGQASGRAASDTFVADVPYRGTFADPTVMVDGSRYVASATTTANINLPIMTSSDLATWTPRPALPDARRFNTWKLYNEPMVVKPAWAAAKRQRQKVALISQWAPSLAKLQGRYVAAFSAAVTLSPRKSCVGVATSPTAIGMYVPASRSALVCYAPSRLGAIDPDIFVDPRTGRPWLLWKNEGVHNTHGPRLMARRLTPAGTAFAPGSKPVMLATVTQGWESGVVENPSMVHHRGRYYLLYSGNHWRTAGYATSYAVCTGPAGPCTKPGRGPILASGAGTAGPGGADAFVDLQGRLRFAYAAWDAGRVGGAQVRRMRIGTLSPVAGGDRLVVTTR